MIRPEIRLETTVRFVGNRLDPPERENRLLEVRLFDFDDFDSEVLHTVFIERMTGLADANGIGVFGA